MPHAGLRSPVGRAIAAVAARLRGRWYREDVPESLRIAPPDDAKPSVPAAYMPLYTYLERRYAGTVVLTFEQIRGLARIRAAVTSVRRCGVVDGQPRGKRSPYGGMDRRASPRRPPTECSDRGVRTASVIAAASAGLRSGAIHAMALEAVR